MLEALKNTLGVVTPACVTVGIARSTHYQWLQDDEAYRAVVDDVSEIAIDFAESKLHANIKNGDIPSILFYLKTKGKKRGYVEKQEVDMNANLRGSIPIDEWIKDRIK
jgi:hypothetical protein